MNEDLRGAPYRNSKLSHQQRCDDLIERMNLEEKLAQLAGVWGRQLVAKGVVDEEAAYRLVPNGIGHISRNSLQKTPFESAEDANALQAWFRERTRLGIPVIIHEEACAGLMARGACAFPMPIGMGSTFNPDLMEAVASVIRHQMRCVGASQALAPVLDVARDHRWGRIEETFGEDPYLTSRMGVSFIRGVQGHEADSGVACTAKHFVGYSASASGLNWAPASIGTRELRDDHLPSFAAAISEASVLSVMNAYQEIDGIPVAASRELLTKVLRDELGFTGAVVSDYDALSSLHTYHQLGRGKVDAAALGLHAGIDLELPVVDCFGGPLRQALAEGLISIEDIDLAVRRILMLKFRLGLFEWSHLDSRAAPKVFEDASHRSLALEAAVQSMVLLRNEGGLLPLERVQKIAVVGPSSHSLRNLQGTYQYPSFYEYQFGPLDGRISQTESNASDNNVAAAVTLDAAQRDNIAAALSSQFPGQKTIFEAILAGAPAGSVVRYEQGCDINLKGDSKAHQAALDLALESDVVIAVMGGRSGLAADCTEGEFNDRSALELPGAQEDLLKGLVATGRPVILVLINGRPPCLTWASENVPSILEAWLPGESGPQAIADILFGKANPSGRLPVSLSRGVGQMPIHYHHKPSGRRSFPYGGYKEAPATALYPFGHGLSYTSFECTKVSASSSQWEIGEAFSIRAQVSNVGRRSGTAVVQLYLSRSARLVTAPVKLLKAFARVELEPGQTRSLEFTLNDSALVHAGLGGSMVIEPGSVRIQVGASSAEVWSEIAVDVVGHCRDLKWQSMKPANVIFLD